MTSHALRHLQTALRRVDELTRRAMARAQAAGQDPTDMLQGLIITAEDFEASFARAPLAGLWEKYEAPSPAESQAGPLMHLAEAFALTSLDYDILLICLAPELDPRYTRIFGYLQNDITKPRATVHLVMNLLGGTLKERFAVWDRLTPEAPLRANRLIVNIIPEAGQAEPVHLAQQLRLDERIVRHLLGNDAPDSRLKDAVCRVASGDTYPVPDALRNVLPSMPIVYLQGQTAADRRAAVAALCAEKEMPVVWVSMARLKALEMPWRLAFREGRLAGGALVLEGWEHALDEQEAPPAAMWDDLLAYEGPVFLCSSEDWEPRTVQRTRRLVRRTMEIPPYAERLALWERALAAQQVHLMDGLDELAGKFRLTPAQVTGAVQTAADFAISREQTPEVNIEDLYAGARAHSSVKLGQLAQKVTPRFDWDDLILPPDRLAQLREICARARYADRVHEDWGFGEKIAPERGISALFAGESGTGKTMAAGVIAKALGLEMYRIDLSGVVSKYIGETEKNLRTIFLEAHASNAVLFFDEADALFGKRSEVKDAHDRYANIEIAYLLQQIESYDGIAVLATNLRQNLDEAFTRRLDFMIDFPFPDAEHRRRIWVVNFPSGAPLAESVDLDALADRYRLAGGNIRNAALASAYLAAADGGAITEVHLLHAIRREHQKMGRLIDDTLSHKANL